MNVMEFTGNTITLRAERPSDRLALERIFLHLTGKAENGEFYELQRKARRDIEQGEVRMP